MLRALTRNYAKKARQAAPAAMDESASSFSMDPFKLRMQKQLDHFKVELGNIRVDRAHPGILESVKVQLEGHSTVGLTKIAQINVKDGQTLMVVLNDEQVMDLNLADCSGAKGHNGS